jgi:hypothetical protein
VSVSAFQPWFLQRGICIQPENITITVQYIDPNYIHDEVMLAQVNSLKPQAPLNNI